MDRNFLSALGRGQSLERRCQGPWRVPDRVWRCREAVGFWLRSREDARNPTSPAGRAASIDALGGQVQQDRTDHLGLGDEREGSSSPVRYALGICCARSSHSLDDDPKGTAVVSYGWLTVSGVQDVFFLLRWGRNEGSRRLGLREPQVSHVRRAVSVRSVLTFSLPPVPVILVVFLFFVLFAVVVALLNHLRTIYLWNWMFPLLMTRCDVTSIGSYFAVVTVIPN
jgi:hypothetical protein